MSFLDCSSRTTMICPSTTCRIALILLSSSAPYAVLVSPTCGGGVPSAIMLQSRDQHQATLLSDTPTFNIIGALS